MAQESAYGVFLAGSDLIEWDENKKLTWDDFQGNPYSSTHYTLHLDAGHLHTRRRIDRPARERVRIAREVVDCRLDRRTQPVRDPGGREALGTDGGLAVRLQPGVPLTAR